MTTDEFCKGKDEFWGVLFFGLSWDLRGVWWSSKMTCQQARKQLEEVVSV